jgi:hypothetical protein
MTLLKNRNIFLLETTPHIMEYKIAITIFKYFGMPHLISAL